MSLQFPQSASNFSINWGTVSCFLKHLYPHLSAVYFDRNILRACLTKIEICWLWSANSNVELRIPDVSSSSSSSSSSFWCAAGHIYIFSNAGISWNGKVKLKSCPIYRVMSVENTPWYEASGIWRCNKQASLKSAGTRWSTQDCFKEMAHYDWPSYSGYRYEEMYVMKYFSY